MECAAHPDVSATVTCGRCGRAMCNACAAFSIDGGAACGACAEREEERGRDLAAAATPLLALGYLAALALALVVFRGRPFVGGFAAVATVVLGRMLQAWLGTPRVRRRAHPVDAATPPG